MAGWCQGRSPGEGSQERGLTVDVRKKSKKPKRNVKGHFETSVDTATVNGESITIPNRLGSQSHVAGFLHQYFGHRISITIDTRLISNWRRGERLKAIFVEGKLVRPPPFPNKNKSGFFWDVHECIEWVEKWIVPAYPRTPGEAPPEPSDEINGDYHAQKQSHELWKMRRERQIADGEFKSAEEFRRDLILIGQAINNALGESCEVTLSASIEAAINAIAPTEIWKAKLFQAVQSGCRSAADLLRDKIRKALVKE